MSVCVKLLCASQSAHSAGRSYNDRDEFNFLQFDEVCVRGGGRDCSAPGLATTHNSLV